MTGKTNRVYCCGCKSDVQARLTSGEEIYPRRKDLAGFPFWKCDTCGNYVGCHHKSSEPLKPLGVIPTPEIREWRQRIHVRLDPLWRPNNRKRTKVYRHIATKLGKPFHTADLRSEEECRMVLEIIKEMSGK